MSVEKAIKKTIFAKEESFIEKKIKYFAKTKTLLNIRKEPFGEIVGTFPAGEKIEIYEVNGEWARTKQGWVATYYIEM